MSCQEVYLEGEVHRLDRDLAAERKKSTALAGALRQEKEQKKADKAPSVFTCLEQLRVYLMGNFVLKQHERQLLEQITDPAPKSKEAHIVLICASRYGLSFA